MIMNLVADIGQFGDLFVAFAQIYVVFVRIRIAAMIVIVARRKCIKIISVQ